MVVTIPSRVAELLTDSGEPLVDYLSPRGYTRTHRGKVRDTYTHARRPGWLFVVATDRASIFDFVLPVQLPLKGEYLTAITDFWLNGILKEIPNHLLPVRPPSVFPASRTMVVRSLNMIPYELIVRGYCGGSLRSEYEEYGTLAGQPVRAGLRRWEKLPRHMFTPSTKEDGDHDKNITVSNFLASTGRTGELLMEQILQIHAMVSAYTEPLGILTLDGKVEVGMDQEQMPTLADEVYTPDSARFVTRQEQASALAEGRDPNPLDKELLRIWGRTIRTDEQFGQKYPTLNKLEPTNAQHLAFVAELEVPSDVCLGTMERYQQLFEALVEESLDSYHERRMRRYT